MVVQEACTKKSRTPPAGRCRSVTSRKMPGSHHWSWSSRYEPADHWWTRTASTLPPGLSRWPTANSCGSREPSELSDVRAVQPDPGTGLDPVEAQHRPAVRGPVGRQVEGAQMIAGRVPVGTRGGSTGNG